MLAAAGLYGAILQPRWTSSRSGRSRNEDWATLRDLRLQALSDSPDSFGPTTEMALGQPESYWRGWAAGRAGRLQAWAAYRGPEAVGWISGGIPHAGTGHLGALWVAPSARNAGLAARLLETAAEWCAQSGCTRVEFEVTDGNPAEKLYERLGYRRTGASQPLREGSPLFEVTMARDVPRPGSG